MLKDERQARIVALVTAAGRVVAAELPGALGVSVHTIRRDLDELATAGRLHRVHGGALARGPVAVAPGSPAGDAPAPHGLREVAAAAATLVAPGDVAILDAGPAAVALAQALAPGHGGTAITHSPTVAQALAAHLGLEVVVVGGTLDRRAMAALGAGAVDAFRAVTADVCFVAPSGLHAAQGASSGLPQEAELRRALLGRAARVVALAPRGVLGTVAPFGVGPASALTHLAVERDTPPELLAPFAELGIAIVAPPA